MPNTVHQLAPLDKDSALKQRIIEVFERQSKAVGPRGVVITELVSELGISSKTLYRHFATKADIVNELMNSWAESWFDRQQQGFDEGHSAKQRIETMAIHWIEHTGQFSPQFWLQLERDFPAAYTIHQQQYQAFLERSRQNLSASIRDDLNADLALSGLMALITHASDSDLCNQLNMTRKDSLTQVIDLWAKGALRPELLNS